MIDAKELRIGNWVRTMKGYNQVVDVMCDSVHTMNGGDILDNIDGIELTPEILEKAGFTWNAHHGRWHIGENPVTGDWLFELKQIDRRIFYRNGHFTIETVHRLQNLFYALTQTELNIQL